MKSLAIIARFETTRLLIQSISVADKNMIFELLNSDGWLNYIGDRNIKTLIDAENYIKNILTNNNYSYHVVLDKFSNRPIGILTFIQRTTESLPDLGYALLPEFHGMGMAYEACKVFLDYLKNEKGHNAIIAIVSPDNLKSVNLLRKLGFELYESFNDNQTQLHKYKITL